ncbi:NAF1 [Bugula neritina]|uniref:H/ACA ribonucleoprotein complex non-core subunit NAF1 n=1 Tax=Bugula neritina TaxID=10212 RepID=A0A7J7KCG5_BUGNE|nr:NAF1 [Bugula neritina]
MSLKGNSSTNSSDPLVTEQDCHAEVAHVVGELLTSVAGETQESASCTLNMSSVTKTTQNDCQESPKNDKNCFEHSDYASTSISMLSASDVANDTSQPSKPADVSASPEQPLVASFSVDMQKTDQVYQFTVKDEKPLSDSISATNSHVGNTNTLNVVAGDASNLSSTSMQEPMQSDCGVSDKPPSKTFDSSVNEKVASSSLATSDLQSFSEMQQQERDDVSDVESSSTSEDESSVVELNVKVEVTDVVDEPIKSKVGPTVPGEITLYDLPPIEDLKIAIDENVELVELGVVMNIVDCLVIIKANPGTPALDEDTALFSVERKCVGKVFETFGPVICPFYSIRYNSVEDINVSDVKVTQTIFYAPKEEKSLTTYVFVDRLRNHIDYSDDEQERNAKAKLRSKNRKPTVENTEGGDNFKKSRHSDAPFHRPSHR